MSDEAEGGQRFGFTGCTPVGLSARREVEKALLGAVCKFPSAYYEAAKLVAAEDFYEASHQTIYAAVSSMRNTGMPVDPATLFEYLVSQGRSAEVGGAVYVMEVWDSGASAASTDYYAKKVREQSLLDRLHRTLVEQAEHARRRQGNPFDIISAAEQAVFDVAKATGGIGQDTADVALVIDRVYDLIDRRTKGESHGIPTGLTDLDMILTGLHGGQLIVVASRPAVGKTAVACNLIKSACHNGHLTLLISLEMSAEEIGERLIVLDSGTHSQDLRTGAINQADLHRITKAGDRVRRWPLRINDSAQMRVSSIASAARREHANGLGLLIVDYLQLMEPDSKKATRQEQVSCFSRGLKVLAKSLRIPVVALAQLNRESEHRANSRPKLSDLRDSGAIEQDADVVILLHRDQDMIQQKRLELIVAKHRNGPSGDVLVRYEPEFFRLSDV